jgi:hypothetical protein
MNKNIGTYNKNTNTEEKDVKSNWISPEEIKKAQQYIESFRKEYPNINFEKNTDRNNESLNRRCSTFSYDM